MLSQAVILLTKLWNHEVAGSVIPNKKSLSTSQRLDFCENQVPDTIEADNMHQQAGIFQRVPMEANSNSWRL